MGIESECAADWIERCEIVYVTRYNGHGDVAPSEMPWGGSHCDDHGTQVERFRYIKQLRGHDGWCRSWHRTGRIEHCWRGHTRAGGEAIRLGDGAGCFARLTNDGGRHTKAAGEAKCSAWRAWHAVLTQGTSVAKGTDTCTGGNIAVTDCAVAIVDALRYIVGVYTGVRM